MSDDQELEAFKTQIDLRAFAADQGYALDRKESWRGSSVMRHGNGDKIIVKRDHDGHYVYFSVRDDRDNGSIIDFLQNRRRGSLGAVRQVLRPWVGKLAPTTAPFPALEKTARDRFEVEKHYQRMEDAPAHPYLVNERKLSPALLSSARFYGRTRIDDRGNAVFPHFDDHGLCGYEIKNKGFTSFAKGGEKGLWFSRTDAADELLVIAESAIDALSHAQLFPSPAARYASIGGQMNPRQPSLIRTTILKMPTGAQIVAAMDNDDEGTKFSEGIRSIVNEAARSDLRFLVSRPKEFKDWNELLKSQAPSLPTAPSLLA